MIKAKVIADSLSRQNCRLTTMLVTYPRFVHAEHLRHRMFSFNVSSSRAIPGKKFSDLVRATPAKPVWWGKNQPGMAAREALTGKALEAVMELWWTGRERMLLIHEQLMELGLHKQVANRILEPWLPVTVLVSGTDWVNFFMLRSHPDAQPEMQALSDLSLHRYCASKPAFVGEGEWHLPFSDVHFDNDWTLDAKRRVCVARAARLSYLNFDGVFSLEKDSTLHDQLATSGHWSPFEHVATPTDDTQYVGNFRGWRQYRKLFETETFDRTGTDLNELLRIRQEAGSFYANGIEEYDARPPVEPPTPPDMKQIIAEAKDRIYNK